jgi:hypothetical protein
MNFLYHSTAHFVGINVDARDDKALTSGNHIGDSHLNSIRADLHKRAKCAA